MEREFFAFRVSGLLKLAGAHNQKNSIKSRLLDRRRDIFFRNLLFSQRSLGLPDPPGQWRGYDDGDI